MNFLLSVTWFSDSVCTHTTLYEFLHVALCPSSRPIHKAYLEEWQRVDDEQKT